MKIQPITNNTFGILNTVKTNIEGSKLYGSYRDYDIEIYNNRLLNTTLIYITKFGKWIKSKVKYKDLNKSYTRSYEDIVTKNTISNKTNG